LGSNNLNVLGVCSVIEFNRDFTVDFLKRYLGKYLRIVSVDAEKATPLYPDPKAVIVTRITEASARKTYPKSKIIYAKRTISGDNLEEVIKIPKGTSVLVVNYPEIVAKETVENLQALGINHINLIPYWPECEIDLSTIDTVIYTGIRNYCPDHMKKYIDIGYRMLSNSTLIEIINEYHLPLEIADNFQEDYVIKILEGCYRIESSLRQMKCMKDNFEQVCNLSSNITIGINHLGLINIFNPAAEQFFKASKEIAVDNSYLDFFKEFPALLSLIKEKKEQSDKLLELNRTPFLVSVNNINMDGKGNILLNLTPIEILQKTEAAARIKLHSKGFIAKHNFQDIRGNSSIIKKTLNLARCYAKSEATVLLIGESGTGKELFAQSIHNASKRAGAPFVGINFAALPESLAESELFGYVEGAFTGALKNGKAGLFEIAHKGTIFLDEIGDASLPMQTKLLRVLEEREIVRIGSSSILPIDVRVICATNKNLTQLIREGKFREDLYYRIRILTLNIPPLRQRKEDIPFILNTLKTNEKLPVKIQEKIMRYDWPGNIRELKSLMEYLSILKQYGSGGQEISELADDLFYQFFGSAALNENVPVDARPKDSIDTPSESSLGSDLLAVLNQIKIMKQMNIPVGRYSLSKRQPLKDLNLTEAKIKSRLKFLEKEGYLTLGKTKQGVSLTEKAHILMNTY
jgi:transcriptional regulator with PAS, ATPase and Fis domain